MSVSRRARAPMKNRRRVILSIFLFLGSKDNAPVESKQANQAKRKEEQAKQKT
jgi:hypothetical protein